jgi:hypothetical protein
MTIQRMLGLPNGAVGSSAATLKAAAYFSALETLLNVVFRLVPRPSTVAMIATAMPAAIKPYSMAVAPDWSDRKAVK